jgi:hypothetical protein
MVLDTNTTLHFMRFDKVPWQKVFGKGAAVVVPHVVVDEIDAKSYQTEDRKISRRARGVFGLLESVLEAGPEKTPADEGTPLWLCWSVTRAPGYLLRDHGCALHDEGARLLPKSKVDLCAAIRRVAKVEARFSPLRQFSLANSNHPNHIVQTGLFTPTCAGATRTPATPTSWPPSAANAQVSAANEVSAWAAGHCQPQPDPPPIRRGHSISRRTRSPKPAHGR